MSTIRLLVVKGNTLYSQECPWRSAIRFLQAKQETQHRLLRLCRDKHYLDAGYLLVDMDRELITSNQSAFAIASLPKPRRYEAWHILEPL